MPKLSATPCAFCSAMGLQLDPEGRAVCRFCGTLNDVGGVVCPHCEVVNAAGAGDCSACHLPLQVRCPACGQPNWAGRELCAACRAPLDAVALMASTRYGSDPADYYGALQRGAAAIKAEEEAASQRRMAELNAIEARRQEAIAADRVRKAAQERSMLLGAALLVGGVALMIVIGLVLAAGS